MMYKKLSFLILFFTVSLFAYTGDNLGNHKATKDLNMNGNNIKYTPYKAFISKDYDGTETIDTSTDIISGVGFVTRTLNGFTRLGSSLTYTGTVIHDFKLDAVLSAANADTTGFIHWVFSKNGILLDGTQQHNDFTVQDRHKQSTLIGIVDDLANGDILAIEAWADDTETVQIEHVSFVVTQSD